MIRVRLFFAVAGVLLMSDAAQARTVVRLRRSIETAKSYFKKAYEENEMALRLIAELPFRYEVYRGSEKDSLSRAQRDFKQLLDGTSQSRITTSTWALFWEVGAQFSEESFKERTKECNETSAHMQQAIAYTITAITMEPTLVELLKNKTEDLTKDYIFKNGTIKPGVSEDDMYQLGWNVTEIVGGDFPFQ